MRCRSFSGRPCPRWSRLTERLSLPCAVGVAGFGRRYAAAGMGCQCRLRDFSAPGPRQRPTAPGSDCTSPLGRQLRHLEPEPPRGPLSVHEPVSRARPPAAIKRWKHASNRPRRGSGPPSHKEKSQSNGSDLNTEACVRPALALAGRLTISACDDCECCRISAIPIVSETGLRRGAKRCASAVHASIEALGRRY
jgi:hypothetical protein